MKLIHPSDRPNSDSLEPEFGLFGQLAAISALLIIRSLATPSANFVPVGRNIGFAFQLCRRLIQLFHGNPPSYVCYSKASNF